MAIPPGVIRWTLKGTSSAEEVWNFDWWTQPGVGIASAAAFQATVDAMWAVIVAAGLHTQLASLLPTTGAVTELSALYYRNAQTAEYSGQHIASPAVAGISNTRAPLQTAFVVTTLTDRPGASYRGRMYLAACGMPLDATHKFTAGSMVAVVNALKAVIGAGNTDGQYGPPVVVSRTKTAATQIKTLRYDLKPDIQRRRANRQTAGARISVAVP